MIRRPLVIVGDTLLDVDLIGVAGRVAHRTGVPAAGGPVTRIGPGGAGLAALMAAGGPRPVILVTALGSDGGGDCVRAVLGATGVTLIDLGLSGPTPEKVRFRGPGRMRARPERFGRPAAPVGPLTPAAMAAIQGAAALIVSDYGGGITASRPTRELLADLAPDVPLVWDPHRRGGDPVPGTLLVTPNVAEAAHFSGQSRARGTAQLIAQGRALAKRWQVAAVAITRSEHGALLVAAGGSVMNVPTSADDGDSCWAGDCLAATAALELAGGAPVDEALTGAVAAATSFVAGGGVAMLGLAAPAHDPGAGPGRISSTAERVRAEGGTVVATGGCFDLLHAGHLSVLRGARSLGDCLIVCLNSDASVRGLKGPGRPVIPLAARESVLRALPWVDDVIVFDEASPSAVLRELRPDIWAKGGDYSVDDLPEAGLVRSWGGEIVTLPYLQGHSTTRLLEQGVLGGRPGDASGCLSAPQRSRQAENQPG